MDRAGVEAWIAGYERSWRSPGTDHLRDLFSDDASYRMSPYHDAFVGLEQIAELWERERRSPDEPFDMSTEVIAVDGDRAVVRVEVRYHDTGNDYRDLWVLRFDENGHCSDFEEWPFSPTGGPGYGASGPS